MSEILGQPKVQAALTRYVKRYRKGKADQPNMLLVGPSGVGKTSAAHAYCQDLYGAGWKSSTLELNASDERGIEVIRKRVKGFARTVSTAGELFSVVILDEADHLTNDAQAALRRMMEMYSKSCRFILLANYPNKLIPALRSRCTPFRFQSLDVGAGVGALERICKSQKVQADMKALGKLWRLAEGDLRLAINVLQGCGSLVNEYSIDEYTFNKAAMKIIHDIPERKLKDAETEALVAIRQGMSPEEFFGGIYRAIRDGPTKEPAMSKCLFAIGEYEYRVATGGNFEIQARCMLRQFFLILERERGKA